MNTLLEAFKELNKISESFEEDFELKKWDIPEIKLSDIEEFPYISHFTDTVKSFFCILETQILKPKNTNKEFALCFSYMPFIEHERDPNKFKYGILFNKNSFIQTLKRNDPKLQLNTYHATAKKLSSGKKELRLKAIWKTAEGCFLKFLTYDFSTPIKISSAFYDKIKNHMLYLEKRKPTVYSIDRTAPDSTYEEYLGYRNVASKGKGQNLYLTTDNHYQRRYEQFEELMPFLLDPTYLARKLSHNPLRLITIEVSDPKKDMNYWKQQPVNHAQQSIVNSFDYDDLKPFRNLIGKYNMDLKKFDLNYTHPENMDIEKFDLFRIDFGRFYRDFVRDFEYDVIWVSPEEADEIYFETDEGEIRAQTSNNIHFNIRSDIYKICIPVDIEIPSYKEEYKDLLKKLTLLIVQNTDITPEMLKEFPDEVLLYQLSFDFKSKIMRID